MRSSPSLFATLCVPVLLVGIALTGCTPASGHVGGAAAGDSRSPSPKPAGPTPAPSGEPTVTPPTPQRSVSPKPQTPPGGDDAAGDLGRAACSLFGTTFDQRLATKFPNQEKATSMAQQASRQDAGWQAIAEDMSLITTLGKRINLDHDATVTPEESNAAGQAVGDLQRRCADAGAPFTLPSD